MLLLLGVVLIWAPLVRSHDEQPAPARKSGYAVQYSSRLNLSSASEIDKRLHAAFAEGTAHPAGVDNCVQLLAKCGPASHGNCDGRSSSTSKRDLQAQKSTLVDCFILRELQHATRATSSHVAELKWDDHILSLLPPQLAINVSAESLRKAKVAATRGQSWPDFDKSATASTDGPDQIVVQGDGFRERLILWGRGDFNGDGVEDLLVQSLDTLTEGTYRNTRLFILTRKTPRGKLSLVRAL
jgi:hypothetical protein